MVATRKEEEMTHEEELNKAAKEAASTAYPYEERGIVYDEEKVNETREYYQEGFITGVKWAMEQGESYETRVMKNGLSGYSVVHHSVESFKPDEKVIVQIRKNNWYEKEKLVDLDNSRNNFYVILA